MLYKVREFVNTRVLKLIYHAIFDCHLNYVNAVWGQNKNSLNFLFLLQKKTFRIISFECRKARPNPLFYRHEIVKLHDKIIIEYCLFISKSINFDLPSSFNHWFTFSSDPHRYEKSCSSKGFLKVNIANTKKYDREALIKSATSYENCLLISKSINFDLPSILIIGLPFPQTLIGTRHLVLRKDS